MSVVEIWTDGACSQQNGSGYGPGGWAAVLEYAGNQRHLYGHEPETTNQRMELVAAYKALATLKRPCRVRLYSDSAYLVNAMTRGWLEKWKQNGWKNSKKQPVSNVALWELLEEAASRHQVEWVKVPAHAQNDGNNKADALAYAVARGAKWREEAS